MSLLMLYCWSGQLAKFIDHLRSMMYHTGGTFDVV